MDTHQQIPANGSNKLSAVSVRGKWETYLKHTGLMRYIPSGVFFARFKVNGKIRKASLETTVKSVAIDLLNLKRDALRKPKGNIGTFANGRSSFAELTKNRLDLAETTRTYRARCVDCILRSWPKLDGQKADNITEADLQAWWKKFSEKYSAPFANGCLNVMREILQLAGLKREDNPAFKIDRLTILPADLHLPNTEQFDRLLHAMESSGAPQAQDCADLTRFLAFSGCRLREAWKVLWRDVHWQENEIEVFCSKRRAKSQERRTRLVPIVPAMNQLLKRIEADHKPKLSDRVCRVLTCDESLTNACAKIGCARLTHHDLRHLFATFCIEAGIDIPSVSRWLGHSDGGALAMKTYGHLRREHAQRMAQKVTFGLLPPALPVIRQPI